MYTLANAIGLNKKYPNTFFIPSKYEITKLEVGDIVKLIFREDKLMAERMWVQISEPPTKNDGILNFVGILDNDPGYLKTVKYGDKVEFTEEHIIAIYEEYNNN